MNMTSQNNKVARRSAIFSTIWIFLVLNYLYCDVLSLMDSELLNEYLSGTVGGMEISQGFLLAAGLLMEISIGMVLLSRVLPYRSNRRANIIAGSITAVVQAVTLFVGKPTMYYLLFSTIEIASSAFVVWYAWTWHQPAGSQLREEAAVSGAAIVHAGER
jgi:hypothetical protein